MIQLIKILVLTSVLVMSVNSVVAGGLPNKEVICERVGMYGHFARQAMTLRHLGESRQDVLALVDRNQPGMNEVMPSIEYIVDQVFSNNEETYPAYADRFLYDECGLERP